MGVRGDLLTELPFCVVDSADMRERVTHDVVETLWRRLVSAFALARRLVEQSQSSGKIAPGGSDAGAEEECVGALGGRLFCRRLFRTRGRQVAAGQIDVA